MLKNILHAVGVMVCASLILQAALAACPNTMKKYARCDQVPPPTTTCEHKPPTKEGCVGSWTTGGEWGNWACQANMEQKTQCTDAQCEIGPCYYTIPCVLGTLFGDPVCESDFANETEYTMAVKETYGC